MCITEEQGPVVGKQKLIEQVCPETFATDDSRFGEFALGTDVQLKKSYVIIPERDILCFIWGSSRADSGTLDENVFGLDFAAVTDFLRPEAS